MRRRLRIMASYCCFAICFFVAVVWVHSYNEFISCWRLTGGHPSSNPSISCFDGKVKIRYYLDNHSNSILDLLVRKSDGVKLGWRVGRDEAEDWRTRAGMDRIIGVESWRFVIQPPNFFSGFRPKATIKFPLWFLFVFAGLSGALLRPRPRWRIGLREMFAITTIVAGVLGEFACLLRLAENQ